MGKLAVDSTSSRPHISRGNAHRHTGTQHAFVSFSLLWQAASTLKYLTALWDPCSRTHAAAMPGRYYDLIYLGPPPLAWFPSGCLRLICSHMRLSRGRVAALSQTLDDTGAPELKVTWTAGHIAGQPL